jgi:hypothetical protein
MRPEFIRLNKDYGTYFEFGCIFDFEEPFDKEPLRAGVNQTLVNLIFDVAPGAPQGATTQVAMVNNRDLSPILNIFTIDGFTRVPALTPSTVKILDAEQPHPALFVRGNSDMQGKVDITDAILILNFLFLGGPAPACMDAADVDDSGRLDISDSISLLNFLFLGGTYPAVPYPAPGLDPTPDPLKPCET